MAERPECEFCGRHAALVEVVGVRGRHFWVCADQRDCQTRWNKVTDADLKRGEELAREHGW